MNGNFSFQARIEQGVEKTVSHPVKATPRNHRENVFLRALRDHGVLSESDVGGCVLRKSAIRPKPLDEKAPVNRMKTLRAPAEQNGGVQYD